LLYFVFLTVTVQSEIMPILLIFISQTVGWILMKFGMGDLH